MPFYVSLYLGKTSHLTTLEHGAYLLLILHYWQVGGLPADDIKLAKIAHLSDQQWSKIRCTIADFFEPDWKHEKVEHELSVAASLIGKRSAAGKAGASARYGKRMANASESHGHLQEQLPKPVGSKKEGAPSPRVASPKPLVFEIPAWVPKEAWEGWMDVRKKKGAVQSTKALGLALTELENLRDAGEDPEAVLNQAILGSWKSLYAVKSKPNGANGHGRESTPTDRYLVGGLAALDALAEEDRRRGGH